MKTLNFNDRHGNRAVYTLLTPDAMDHWRVGGFLQYMAVPYPEAHRRGWLPQPVDTFDHERLRQLINTPANTLNAPIALVQNGRTLGHDDVIDLSETENTVTLKRHRDGLQDAQNLCLADRNIRSFTGCRNDIVEAFDKLFDFDAWPIIAENKTPIASLNDIVDGFERLDIPNRLRFAYRTALIIYQAPFENLSKILDGASFRTGGEMWYAIGTGYGGICAEKTAALKFIADIVGIPSHPVMGSLSRIPDNYEGELRAYVDSNGATEPSVWMQHHLLVLHIGEGEYLVDTTNGNIPFLFLDDTDTAIRLRSGMRARMVYNVERLHLKAVSNWVGDALLTLSEFHVPDLNFQYIFKQGVGLHISDRAFVGAYFDWSEARSALMQNYYSSRAKRAKLPYPSFLHRSNFNSIPDKPLRVWLEAALDALHEEYMDDHYTGDFTFVLQPLSFFWQRPQVSHSVRAMLWDSYGIQHPFQAPRDTTDVPSVASPAVTQEPQQIIRDSAESVVRVPDRRPGTGQRHWAMATHTSES